MSSNMPDFNAPADQAEALAFYISHEANLPLAHKPAPAEIPAVTNHSRLVMPVRVGGGGYGPTDGPPAAGAGTGAREVR
jgi:hypothetical protein